MSTAPRPAIPRRFHQTWKDGDVPPEFRGHQKSWLRHNPDWEYAFWTDASARRFVADRTPWLLAAYDAFPHDIQRVDVARYVWMREMGGVYADLDCECLRPLDELIEGRELVLGLEPREHVGGWVTARGIDRIVCNAFIASRAGHPFWDHLLALVARHADVDDPLESTGPFLLTRAVAGYPHPERITIAPAKLLYPAAKREAWGAERAGAGLRLPPESFAVHHWAGTWWRKPEAGAPEAPIAPRATNRRDGAPKILVATPVKDARAHLPRYLDNLRTLTHPHAEISVTFLESDSTDGTYEWLRDNAADRLPGFGRVEVHRADFGFRPSGPRWATSIQRRRREILARSRNRLLQRALRDEEWVLWVDVDVVRYPPDVVQRLLDAGKDIVVPHCLDGNGRTFDLNTFRLSDDRPDLSRHVVDGILQPPRGVGRTYLEDLRDEPIVEVDGVGGTMLLVRADHHRDGLVFPCYPHRLYIETEGLAMMARDMGLRCWGLPHLEIHHA